MLPVVLVHGLRTSRTMWRFQEGALRGYGYRTLAIDMPGHGRRRGERFTLDGAVEAVADGVQEVGGRAAVVGLSLGGYIGIAHAARHPEQVAGLVAASCCTRPLRLLVDGWAMLARGIAGLPDAGAGLNQWSVDRVLSTQAAQDVAAGGFALDVMDDVLRAMRSADPVGDLRRIEAPVWLVNGRYDHFRGEERRFLAACRDGRLVIVPRATHLASLSAPVGFTRVLLECLGSLDQSTVSDQARTPPVIPA